MVRLRRQSILLPESFGESCSTGQVDEIGALRGLPAECRTACLWEPASWAADERADLFSAATDRVGGSALSPSPHVHHSQDPTGRPGNAEHSYR